MQPGGFDSAAGHGYVEAAVVQRRRRAHEEDVRAALVRTASGPTGGTESLGEAGCEAEASVRQTLFDELAQALFEKADLP